MNNKGFTMIELLASMVLLSILMLTAVPTVLRVMDNSRKTTIINDAKKFVSNVEYKIKNNNNNIVRPRVTSSSGRNCILVTLGYLDLGSEFKEGPHGGAYSLDDSYVIVKLKDYNKAGGIVQTYDYYVTLVEKYDNNTANYGVYLLPLEFLNGRDAKKYVDGLQQNKLLSKSGTEPKNYHLSGTSTLTGSGLGLGCNNLANDDTDKTNDTIYDSDDALREQGVDVD